jgi:hypothetical protein
MGRTSAGMGEMRSVCLYENSETLSGRSHMGDLEVDKRIILIES